jgi:Protein of unknown function (DUF4087)
MRLALTIIAALACGPVAATPKADKTEKRCGYLVNPTPANWWLTDRDGEWLIGAQGGYQAQGLKVLPESFFEKGWVRINGSYGYRCACLTVTTHHKTMHVQRIFAGQPLSMKHCTRDKAIRRGE